MVHQVGTRSTPRADLGEALMEFASQQGMMIGTQVMPVFPSQEKAGVFNAITRECLTRDVDTKRAPRANYNREGIETKEINFSCEEHGLEGILDDSERNLYASDFDAELVTSQGIQQLLMIAQEKRIASALFNTTTWTGAALYTDVSGNPWDNVASDAIGQVKSAREKVRQNTGLEPNALIIGKTNLDRLIANTAIKAAIQYVARLTEAELINALSDILGIKKIFVGAGIRNSANKGKTFSGADIWSDDYAMVAVVAEDRNNLAQPSVGRTVLWVKDSPENVVVEQYRAEGNRGDVFRVRQNVDELVVDPYFGHLLKVDA